MNHEPASDASDIASAISGNALARARLRRKMEALGVRILALYPDHEVALEVAMAHFDQALEMYWERYLRENLGAAPPFRFSTYMSFWMSRDIESFLTTQNA